jgi:hypothetical protein
MYQNKLYIGFVCQKTLYGKIASWLVNGPYHHTIVCWYDRSLENYVAAEITPDGGVKIHSLQQVMKKYKWNCELYSVDNVTPDQLLPYVRNTFGWKYDTGLLIKNLFRLLAYKLFNFVPIKGKKENNKRICSEWATYLLEPLQIEEISSLTPHLTSPEHLRQAIIKSKRFTLLDDISFLGVD